jgi:hypothetical protein
MVATMAAVAFSGCIGTVAVHCEHYWCSWHVTTGTGGTMGGTGRTSVCTGEGGAGSGSVRVGSEPQPHSVMGLLRH